MMSLTLNEWLSIIHSLPNNKASGPSQISNEMLKHLGKNTSYAIWKLMCSCLQLKDIPDDWKVATIYPIPKPTEWECRLNKTRPITLLETTRKAIVKIINQRLANILSQHKVLRGENYAGLPGGSTLELIKILNAVIEEARENNKECWMLFQDISKAYDRVKLPMLQKAMKRIKIPDRCIRFISSLFTNRRNKVITSYGLTSEYKVLVGIDQGEVISPLLWCIYYDPLLCEAQQVKQAYTMKHCWKPNLTNNQIIEIKKSINAIAYMDDTTWLANSKTSLKSTLTIAQEFYELNGILVNKEKSVLMVINPRKDHVKDYDIPLQLVFGNNTINIKPLQPKESTRFLGMWVNAQGDKEFVRNQIRSEVIKITNVLKKKQVTDKQIIEYRMQLTVFSMKECNKLRAEYHKLFKNKTGIAYTASNSLLTNSHIYDIFDIYSIQKRSQTTNLIAQLNDKFLLGEITNIRLHQLQHEACMHNSPLENWQYTGSLMAWKNNLIALILTITSKLQYKIIANNHDEFNIQGGIIPIINIFSDSNTYNKISKDLKNKNILFLDQITSTDSDLLLTWQDLASRDILNKVSKTPKWYKLIKTHVCAHDNTYRLLDK